MFYFLSVVRKWAVTELLRALFVRRFVCMRKILVHACAHPGDWFSSLIQNLRLPDDKSTAPDTGFLGYTRDELSPPHAHPVADHNRLEVIDLEIGREETRRSGHQFLHRVGA